MTERDLLLLAQAREAACSGRAAAIREGAGLSQAEVASSIGVSSAAVSRWEAGLRIPRGLAAIRWMRLLLRLEETRSAA